MITIKLAGVDITSDCIISRCEFVSQTNGEPGTCSVTVRADTVQSFVIGSRIECLINGTRAWDGYLMQIERAYPFVAMEVGPNSPRFYVLHGVDVNILFQKRVVFNTSSLASMDGPLFPPNTPDTTAINALVTSWLDLSSDNLNVTSGIVGVATINEDQPARPFGPSHTFGQAMAQISALTGAVWYIDPDRVLRYVDDEQITAPFGITDDPSATPPGYIGAREIRLTFGTEPLTNDFFAWGMGYGSDSPVATRVTDAWSVSTFGRWQDARVYSAVYKQATINRIGNSYVYGSPANNRGRNEPPFMVTCKVFEHGLRAGMVVSVWLNGLGFGASLPIRKLTIRPITTNDAEYELVLARIVDTPWTTIDPWRIARPRLPRLPSIRAPLPSLPGVGTGTCADIDCGLTDTFTRVSTLGWGYSDVGILWSHYWSGTDSSASFSVSSGKGIIAAGSGSSVKARFGSARATLPHTIAATVYMTGPISPGSESANTENAAINASNSLLQFYPEWQSSPSSPVGRLQLRYRGYTPTGSRYDGIDFTQPVRVKMEVTTTDVRARWWYVGNPEPSTWHVSINYAAIGQPPPTDTTFAIDANSAPFTSTRDFTWYFDDIDHSSFSSCALSAFDTFTRTTPLALGSADWGISSSGFAWVTGGISSGQALYCNGYAGVFHCDNFTGFGGFARVTIPELKLVPEWTVRVRFRVPQDLSVLDFVYTDLLSVSVLSSGSIILNMNMAGNGWSQLGGISLQGSDPVPFSWQPGEWYEVRLFVSWLGTGAGTTKARVWREGEAEPQTWLLERSHTVEALVNPDLRLNVASNMYTTDVQRTDEILIDEIDFSGVGSELGFRPCAEATTETLIDNWFRSSG